MQIREATDADWPAIWPFMHEIVAAGETYSYAQDLTEHDARAMWMSPPPSHTAVAVEPGTSRARSVSGDTILGTARMYPNQGGPGSHIASASYMVDPQRSGHGVGRALGEYSLDWARRRGFRAMQFNAVVESNTRAVQLWKSLGFEVLGTVPEGFHHPQHGYVGLHIMLRRL